MRASAGESKGMGGMHIRWDDATAPELECIEKRRRRRARQPDGGARSRGGEGRRRDDRDESKAQHRFSGTTLEPA